MSIDQNIQGSQSEMSKCCALKPMTCTKLALIQSFLNKDKLNNIHNAVKHIREAADNGAKIICLPELFTSPIEYLRENAEEIPGFTTNKLSEIAQETQTWIIAGSIPELKNNKMYNTCTVFNPQGKLVSQFSKLHLFDVNIPDFVVQESSVMHSGDTLSVISIPELGLRVGIGICYDLRFPELAYIYANPPYSCNLLLFPGGFGMITGPAHQHLLARARACDNQVWLAVCSLCRDEQAAYVAYGHSCIVSPWGEIKADAGYKENIIYADVDLQYLHQIRQQMPIITQKRKDLYTTVKWK